MHHVGVAHLDLVQVASLISLFLLRLIAYPDPDPAGLWIPKVSLDW